MAVKPQYSDSLESKLFPAKKKGTPAIDSLGGAPSLASTLAQKKPAYRSGDALRTVKNASQEPGIANAPYAKKARHLQGQTPGNQYIGKPGNAKEKPIVEEMRFLESQIHDYTEAGKEVPAHIESRYSELGTQLNHVRKGIKAVKHGEAEEVGAERKARMESAPKYQPYTGGQGGQVNSVTGERENFPEGSPERQAELDKYYESHPEQAPGRTTLPSTEGKNKAEEGASAQYAATHPDIKPKYDPMGRLEENLGRGAQAVSGGVSGAISNTLGQIAGPVGDVASGIGDVAGGLAAQPFSLGAGAAHAAQDFAQNGQNEGIRGLLHSGIDTMHGMIPSKEDDARTMTSKFANLALLAAGARHFGQGLGEAGAGAAGEMPKVSRTPEGHIRIEPKNGIPTTHGEIDPNTLTENPATRGRMAGVNAQVGRQLPPEEGAQVAPIKGYRHADGTTSIIDGAKRAAAAKAAGKPIQATLFDEKDGVSPETAKAAGLLQNETDGTASPEDLAELERMKSQKPGEGPGATPRPAPDKTGTETPPIAPSQATPENPQTGAGEQNPAAATSTASSTGLAEIGKGMAGAIGENLRQAWRDSVLKTGNLPGPEVRSNSLANQAFEKLVAEGWPRKPVTVDRVIEQLDESHTQNNPSASTPQDLPAGSRQTSKGAPQLDEPPTSAQSTPSPSVSEPTQAQVQPQNTEAPRTSSETPQASSSASVSPDLTKLTPDEHIAAVKARRDARLAAESKIKGKQAGAANIGKEDIKDLGDLIHGYLRKGAKTVEDAVRSAFKDAKGWFPGASDESINKALATAVERHVPRGAIPGDKSASQTGISHRVNEAQKGAFGEVPRGQGFNPDELVKRGQDAIKNGTDPQKALNDFKKNPSAATNLAGVIRAHELDLQKAYKSAIGTPEEAAAKEAVSKWNREIKPVATDLSNAFKTYQGATDIDSGNWQSLAAEHTKGSPAPTTPEIRQEAKARAEKVKKARTNTSESEAKNAQQTRENIEKAPKPKTPKTLKEFAASIKSSIEDGSLFQEPRTRQSGAASVGSQPHFSPEQRAQLWNILKKEYLEPATANGEKLTLSDLARRVTRDFAREGVTFPEDWTRDVVGGRKSPLRELDQETLAKRLQRRAVEREARAWAKQGAAGAGAFGKLRRGLGVAYNIPRAALTFGHGIVWPITHAGSAGLDPSVMGHNMGGYWNAIKLLKPANLEDMYEHMEAQDNYPLKIQSGLRVSPESEDDLQHYSDMFAKLHKVGKAFEFGQRQMEGLKFWRNDMFDQIWDQAPGSLKGSPEDRVALGRDIARQVNHMSGTTHPDEGFGQSAHGANYEKGWRNLMFGPNLFRARLYNMIGDPIRTGKTLTDWKNATPSQRWMAQYRVTHAARAATTYVGTLAANYALLKSLGKSDDENVNFFDPSRPDWLLVKSPFGGTSFDVSGGRIGIAKTAVSMINDLKNGGLRGEDGPTAAASEPAKKLLGGMHPAIQLGFDVARGHDFEGQPYPFASAKEKAKGYAHGKPPMSIPEMLLRTTGPIPIQDTTKAVADAFRSQHFDATFARKLAEAFVSGLSGAREVEPPKPKPLK